MKCLIAVATLLLGGACACAQIQAPTPPGKKQPSVKLAPQPKPKYGSNPAAAHTFVHDGVKLYYEVYGTGQPLLVVHGNGASIGTLSAQIDFFRKKYKVIAMDSRDHGKSGDSPGPLTYEAMAGDLAALLEELKAEPAYVLGWSDGGIEALILGMKHPAKVSKIAAMAANLNPSDAALYPEVIALAQGMLEEQNKATPRNEREYKVTSMLLVEPHIDVAALGAIQAPTLILSGDTDLIRLEHTLDIFEHIPNAELCVFPGSTHAIPFDDPATFNGVVDRFFGAAFLKKDRVKDTMKSFEAMQKAAQ